MHTQSHFMKVGIEILNCSVQVAMPIIEILSLWDSDILGTPECCTQFLGAPEWHSCAFQLTFTTGYDDSNNIMIMMIKQTVPTFRRIH